MTQAHLRPCPSCARHVRVNEEGCPFCGESLGDEFRATPRPLGPGVRLTRAALFAFGTGTLAVATGACSSTSSTPVYGGSPVAFDAGDDGGSMAPDATAAAEASAADAEPDVPVATPAYGAPGQPVGPVDASDDQHVGVMALYGLPPHP